MSNEDAAARTCALIVGVEEYTGSAPFPALKGAVRSALQFRNWAKACGIPKDQTFLHLSPRKAKSRAAGWQDLVVSKEALKSIEADTLLIYWAGHGDLKHRNRRLYTNDSDALQHAVDVNSMFDTLSSAEMPFKTLFGFVDACASAGVNQFRALKFPEQHSDPQATPYIYFASSLGEEANYDDGGQFSQVLFDWLEGVRLPLDPVNLDRALSARFLGLEQRFQRPVRIYINRAGQEYLNDADDQVALQYSVSIRKEWQDRPDYRRTILPRVPQPGTTEEDPSFLIPELDLLQRQFSESTAAAKPDESAKPVDPLEFLATHGHAVLLGEPGAGKTTLLHGLEQTLLPPQPETLPKRFRGRIPLFIDLSRWDRGIKNLDDLILLEAGRVGANAFATQWPVLKKKRKFVLIFDGLDRMPQRPLFDPQDEKLRIRDVDPRIERIRAAADDFDCILSCRSREFDGRPVWRDLHLLPVTDSEIREFAALAKFTEQRTVEFLDWLTHHTLFGRSLRELAGTPYWLLRLLSFFHQAKKSGQKLNYEHLVLYTLGDALESLAYRKRLSKPRLNGLRRNLMNLAFHMTAASLRRADKEDVQDARSWLFRNDLIDWHREALLPKRELTPEFQAEADQILSLCQEAGVLMPNRDVIEFEHQLTQECFCLLYCMDKGVSPELLAQGAQRQFSEVWRLWAQQHPKVVEEVIAYLYPAWGDLPMANAAEVLGMLGHECAVEHLLPLLRSRHVDSMVRLVVTNALGHIGDREALPALLDVLGNHEESDTLRGRAAYAAGLIGDPAAVDTLIGLLNADPDIAVQAAHALGRIGDPRAVGPLVELLRQNNHETTLAASNALIWIGKPAVGAILPILLKMAAGIGLQDALRVLLELGGIDMNLLNRLARKHKQDPGTTKLIEQAGSRVMENERKVGKPRHRPK